MNKEPDTTIYQLKIGIWYAHPPIWRRVLVPADYTLAQLHLVIQALMGWYDDHLHQYEVPGPGNTDLLTRRAHLDSRFFASKNAPDGTPLDWLEEDEMEDEAKAVLRKVAPEEKFHFLYIYDMMDGWVHDIWVEKILPAAPESVYPLCVTGRRNGPLEDCGGIWGYEAMLKVLADPTHEAFKDVTWWLQQVYDVDTWDGAAFDLAEINARLVAIRPKVWRKARRAPRRRI